MSSSFNPGLTYVDHDAFDSTRWADPRHSQMPNTAKDSTLPGTYVDMHGRKRDSYTHLAIIEIFEGSHPYSASDALAMAELDKLNYKIPSLDSASRTGLDENKNPIPVWPFITSPNMYFIPDIREDSSDVTVRKDGRYGYADFSLFPQWYFQGTYYLPYVRRKPQNPKDSQFPIIWYDLKESDFILDNATLVNGIGRIRPALLEKLVAARKKLTDMARALETDPRFTYVQLSELRYSIQSMLFATVALKCAPQSYTLTLLTFTGFQRHFLEAWACYDYLTTYRDMKIDESGREPIVRTDLMGCFTTSIDTTVEMYLRGVPVWLLRRAEDISMQTTVVSVSRLRPSHTIVVERMPGANVVYSGPASVIRNRACQALKVGNVRLGHSAFMSHPGEFTTLQAQGTFNYNHPVNSGNPYAPSSAPPPQVSASSSTATTPTASTSATAASSSTSATTTSSAMSRAASLSGHIRFVIQALEVNRKKFAYNPKSGWPAPNDMWLHGLHRVVVNGQNVWDHGFLQVYRGYPFLDPFVFVEGNFSSNRTRTYFLAWLAVRPGWMARMMDSNVQQEYPRSQTWKNFLVFHVAKLLGISDRHIKQNPDHFVGPPNKRHKNSNPVETFGLSMRPFHNTTPIAWRGEDVGYAGSTDIENMSLKISILKEVTWDLFDHNFRFELLALDRSIFPRHTVDDQTSLSRDTMVTQCFPGNALINVDWPEKDEGLGARKYQDRVIYVEAFRKLLADWPGSAGNALKFKGALTVDSFESSVLEVERIAYPFYCQTFFDYFGQAASILHQRP